MESKNNLLDKLVRIERTINIYKKNKLVKEVEINVPTDVLKEIIVPNNDDPELYDGYKLTMQQLQLAMVVWIWWK